MYHPLAFVERVSHLKITAIKRDIIRQGKLSKDKPTN